ncbi:hypothetical protein D3C78_1499880 [compost metagenome]
MVLIFVLSGGAGYELVHLSNTIFLAPASLAARTVSSNSAMVAIPVEIISGFPVDATFRIN